MTVVVVLGASGFIGRWVSRAVRNHSGIVREVSAPRLETTARDVESMLLECDRHSEAAAWLEGHLVEADVVINAAGLPSATSSGDDALFGANALLPALVARASERTGSRFVHVSSSAVQGRRTYLDETAQTDPFSPYSLSKVVGEELVWRSNGSVVFRPTSVHGPERHVTQVLRSYAGRRWAMVASPGDDPTPQVHVANTAEAIAFLALTDVRLPRIVLQPWEGLTTSQLMVALGGHEPWLVPRRLARAIVACAFWVGARSGRLAGLARRLEMVWFGQSQAPGWLENQPVNRSASLARLWEDP